MNDLITSGIIILVPIFCVAIIQEVTSESFRQDMVQWKEGYRIALQKNHEMFARLDLYRKAKVDFYPIVKNNSHNELLIMDAKLHAFSTQQTLRAALKHAETNLTMLQKVQKNDLSLYNQVQYDHLLTYSKKIVTIASELYSSLPV